MDKGYITFHTNLDRARAFLPFDMGDKFDHIPAKGSIIRFPLPINPKGSYFELEVVRVSYNADNSRVSVELHIPSIYCQSVQEWDDALRNRMSAM